MTGVKAQQRGWQIKIQPCLQILRLSQRQTQIGTTQTDTDPIPDIAGGVQLGRLTNIVGTNFDLNGWLDEVRISKGIARWTGNFTPPTAEY